MKDKIFIGSVAIYIYIIFIQFFDKPFDIYLFQNICLFQKTNRWRIFFFFLML